MPITSLSRGSIRPASTSSRPATSGRDRYLSLLHRIRTRSQSRLRSGRRLIFTSSRGVRCVFFPSHSRSPFIAHFSSSYPQLDKLGLQAGHLPSTYPFNSHLVSSSSSTRRSSLQPPTSPPDASKPKPPISRRELVAALGNQEAFDVLFFETTTKAIDCFSGAQKERSTLELIGSLAVLDLYVCLFSSLAPLFASLSPEHVLLLFTQPPLSPPIRLLPPRLPQRPSGRSPPTFPPSLLPPPAPPRPQAA